MRTRRLRKKNTGYFRHRRSILVLITLIFWAFNTANLSAQNVFISPQTGKLIAAVTSGNESGFQNGFSSLWRHQQLGLTMVVSDEGTLTKGGEIANPAGNFNVVDDKITISGGNYMDCYIVVSIPKGFRFTGYDLTLDNNMNGHRFTRNFSTGSTAKVFYETGSDFNLNNYKAKTDEMPATNDTKGYNIKRTATNNTDMGNRLYFRLHKVTNQNSYYSVSIRSFVIYFAADNDFEQSLQALPFSTPVSVAKASFTVGKPELGTIKPNTKNGQTYYSYDFKNVDDLEASNLLYQESAVKNGMADNANATTKTITRTINLDGGDTKRSWFVLSKGQTDADNTYYVETPVTLTSTNNKEFPTGYRITGATLEFGYGQQDDGGYTVAVNRHGQIYFLQENATMETSGPETDWVFNSGTRRLINSNIYASYASNNDGTYTLTTTSSSSEAATFYVDNDNYIYTVIGASRRSPGTRYYIHEGSTPGFRAVLTTESNYAAQLIPYSGLTPSSTGYTATVYDKTGNNVYQSVDISSSNVNQTITLTGLNNDAIKFKITGLADDGQALVRITLQMQHLNPYIHTLDVVGIDTENEQQKLTQTFTADNFTVRGGRFQFNVPENSKDHTWKFEFDNLTSEYTDDTYASDKYTGATNGNARIALVQSKYFTENSDLYNSNPDYSPVSDKLHVTEVGTEPFRFNNADELSNTSDSKNESQFEEYPFSVEQYLKDTGFKDNNGQPIKGSFGQLTLKADEAKQAYIFVSDETRYNIAPTTATQHRYYAHYALDIQLLAKDFALTVTPVKIYDNTLYVDDSGNEAENSMWGINVSATATDTEEKGYAYLLDVKNAIEELCTKTEGLTSGKQILYVDMSSMSSVLIPAGSGRADNLRQFRDALSPNCLIYLPNNTADKIDNYASKPKDDGSFTANANIVLTDKKPFFAPYDIIVPATSYAKYTRKTTHSTNGKANLVSVVLPFQFTVSKTEGIHTNDNTNDRIGDGKQLTISRLVKDKAIDKDKGEAFKDFDNSMDRNDGYYVHFNIHKPSTGKTEAYKPYLVYVDSKDQMEDDDNFVVLEYGADVKATPTVEGVTASATTANGQVKIADADSKSSGTLDGSTFTLTPTVTMAGCKLHKTTDKCLYFGANRFWSSTTLNDNDPYVYCLPFRSWFDYSGAPSAKANSFGIAFGYSSQATGIDDILTEETESKGTYKFIRNGQLYIHTGKGVFTVDGKKVHNNL